MVEIALKSLSDKYLTIPSQYLSHYPDVNSSHLLIQKRLIEANKSNDVNERQKKKAKILAEKTPMKQQTTLLSFFNVRTSTSTPSITSSTNSLVPIITTPTVLNFSSPIVDDTVYYYQDLSHENGVAANEEFSVEVKFHGRSSEDFAILTESTNFIFDEISRLQLEELRIEIFVVMSNACENSRRIQGDGLCGYRDEYCKQRSADRGHKDLIICDVNLRNESDRDLFVAYLHDKINDETRLENILEFINNRYVSSANRWNSLPVEWWGTDTILDQFGVNIYSKVCFRALHDGKLELHHVRYHHGGDVFGNYSLLKIAELREEVKNITIPVYSQVFQQNHFFPANKRLDLGVFCDLVEEAFVDLGRKCSQRVEMKLQPNRK